MMAPALGTVSTDDLWNLPLTGPYTSGPGQAFLELAGGAGAPASLGFSLSAFLQQNATVIYVGAAALFALALFSGGRR